MGDKFERFYDAQTWFAKNPEIYTSSRDRALALISIKICEVMKIERFGFWRFSDTRDSIVEEMTYAIDGKLTHGKVLFRVDHPIYFEKADLEKVNSISGLKLEKEFHHFSEVYMQPLDVHSLIDAPVFVDGKCIGIACCETTQIDRVWDIHDKNFAAVCASSIGRIIETEKRHSYEKELKHRIGHLEKYLNKKLTDLRETNLRLDLALDAAQAGRWDWNIETGRVELNKTWFRRLGYEYNEIPQDLDSFKRVLHPDDHEKTFAELERHLKGLTPYYECRFRMIMKTGEIQWCIDRGCVTRRNEDGTPLFITGVNINITPIIQLEQSLQLSELQLKAMIRSLPTPVAMFDRHFNYLAYSAVWEKQWGSFAKIEQGKKIVIQALNNEDYWLDNMTRALNGETLNKDEDLVQITADVQLWLKWVIQPWKLANGDIGGVVFMAENITERKLSEMRVSQSSKLAALGEMAGGIAHEINNPLSIIKGYVDLLKRHATRNTLNIELILQYTEKMDMTVGRISRIVNGMRRFSRESSLDEKVNYSLNKIIDETLDICLERINNNGTALTVDYFKTEPIVFCRPVEISQVLLNLINNSFQAISSSQHPWIKIECKELPYYYEIKIIDCGAGIPNFVQKKLFQPFFTTKDIGVGTGLGLSISRGIIEEHHGHLNFIHAPNTTFEIQMPKLSRVNS